MAADPTDIRVPSECREMIRAGALVAVSHSGGKDSQAMTILLSRIVYYLLTLLNGAEPCGLPGTRIECVEFQTAPEGHPLDDIVVRARDGDGSAAVLEIQAKRSLRFTKSDQGFRDVVAQIVQASQQPDFFVRSHELAVALGRAPLNVQGPVRDVLTWARQVGSADTFTARIERPHSANEDMRRFVDAFKAHLANAGAASDAKAVWRLLSRFQILHFDFTAQGSAHEAWQLERAAHALHPDDTGRAEALWQYLVELAIEAATSGGQFDSHELVQKVRDSGFSLAGERRYSSARSAIAEDTRHALEDIADRVGKVHLLRGEHLAAFRTALDQGRYLEIRGEPGVSKSGLLKRLAEERSTQSRIVVLSPGRVRAGGWGAMRTALAFRDTARALLVDLASSGGAALFVDGLDSFSEEERPTVADLVREAAEIPRFSVVATTRRGFGGEDNEPEWLPADALDRLGRVPVTIGGRQAAPGVHGCPRAERAESGQLAEDTNNRLRWRVGWRLRVRIPTGGNGASGKTKGCSFSSHGRPGHATFPARGSGREIPFIVGVRVASDGMGAPPRSSDGR